MPRLPGGGPAGAARPPGGTAGQMLDKQKRKMIRPWFRQAAVPWKTTATQTRASGENRVSTKPGVLHEFLDLAVAVLDFPLLGVAGGHLGGGRGPPAGQGRDQAAAFGPG